MVDVALHKPSDSAARFRPAAVRMVYQRVVTNVGEAATWLGAVHDPSLVPLQLNWGSSGQLTTLRIRKHLGVQEGTYRHAGDPGLLSLKTGDRIILIMRERELFRGFIAQEEFLIQSNPDAEALTFTAYGPEILLQNKAVRGQWHAKPVQDQSAIDGNVVTADCIRDNAFQSHLPVIFNPKGEPNASPSDWALASRYYWRCSGGSAVYTADAKTFVSPKRVAGSLIATHWTAYTALRSLVEWVDDYGVIAPEYHVDTDPADLPVGAKDTKPIGTGWSAIESLLGTTPIGEVNVTGMNLLEAIRAILFLVGFGFCVEPWAASKKGDARYRLRVFSLHSPAQEERPNMASVVAGNVDVTSAAGRSAMVQRIQFVRDSHHVANTVEVIGDQKRKEVALVFADDNAGNIDLRPAWNTTDYPTDDYADDDNNIHPLGWTADKAKQFEQRHGDRVAARHETQGIFRAFAWNEDGAFEGKMDWKLFGGVEATPDLTIYGNGDSYVRRPRPIGRTFIWNDLQTRAQTIRACIGMQIDGDSNSLLLLPRNTYRIWQGRAGFTITVKDLAKWCPYGTQDKRRRYSKIATSETLREKYGSLTYLTLLHNTLRGDGTKMKLFLYGSVDCDEAVKGEATRNLDSSWPFESKRVVYAPNRFKHRSIPNGSDPFASEGYDTRDDETTAETYAEAVRDASDDAVGHGSIILRGLQPRCPGEGIPETEGRVIDLHLDGGTGRHRTPIVVGVSWNFEEGIHKTEVQLESRLLRITQ